MPRFHTPSTPTRRTGVYAVRILMDASLSGRPAAPDCDDETSRYFAIIVGTVPAHSSSICICADPREGKSEATDCTRRKPMDLNTYLSFDGTCEAAFKFYEKVLGGKIVAMMTYADMPGNTQMSKDSQNRIMHARLQFGDNLLMASDAPPDRFEAAKGFHVMLGVKDAAEAERLFEALAAGGTITMPIQGTFWAERFGMLVDRFGTPWMINCEKPA
jgi:PhnB protein